MRFCDSRVHFAEDLIERSKKGGDSMRTRSARLLVVVAGIVVIGVVVGLVLAKRTRIEYRNAQYGFKIALPATWKGYSVVSEAWTGYTNDSQGQVATEHGPKLLIRHPLWTPQNPRQDIPIMVFTLAQWDKIEHEDFYVSAAPIGPSELGRNSTYVFALPPRYNYAYATGWEEVEKILEGKALQTF